MSVKHWDKERGAWVVFPGTPGKTIQNFVTESGLDWDDYLKDLQYLPKMADKIEAIQTSISESSNLVTSKAVYDFVLSNVGNTNSVLDAVKKNLEAEIAGLKTADASINSDISSLKTKDEGLQTSLDSLKTSVDNIVIPDVSGFATKDELSAYAKVSSVPTKVGQLSNDSGYLTSVPSEYITESELNSKGYLTSIPGEYVTESELNNKGYLTQHQDISGKQDVISDLDSIRSGANKGATALQAVPSEYVTEEELNAKDFATKSDVDGVNSQITDINNKINAFSHGLNKASTAGGPGYTVITNNQNFTLSGYSESNPYGVIIATNNSVATFTNAIKMVVDDESVGNYKIYCIMYADDKYFVNMAVYA